ncbi:UNVERIFIED_CONTAM: hypothetical protein RMT77_015902 [Armadillidium vulgare]
MIKFLSLTILTLNFGIFYCKIPIFKDEPQCTVAGGVCLHKDSCEEKFLLPDGICPNQTSKGAICCQLNPDHGECLSKNGGVCVNANGCFGGKIISDEKLCKKYKNFCCVYNDENES